DELRTDAAKALSLIPGRHRFNLHAIYAETGGRPVKRDRIGPEHFSRWVDWAKEQKLGLDFNPTYFAHRLAASGFTLAHSDSAGASLGLPHGAAGRRSGPLSAKPLATPGPPNVWPPDGFKAPPADRKSPREVLAKSLDELFAEPLDARHHRDAVESKL